MLDDLPIDIVLLILELLQEGDLSRVGRVSRKFYGLTIPLLYEVIQLRLSGRFSTMDPVMRKLERFTEPSFTPLIHTSRVVVIGSWYHEYNEVETEAGKDRLLSPAIRMFSILVDICLSKMPRLRAFVWDAEIPPTQRLVSRLSLQIPLEHLQLRLGVDGTPYPLFYPPLRYNQFTQLVSIKLNQINSKDILETVGSLLSSVRRLRDLFIDVDPDCHFGFGVIIAGFTQDVQLSLRRLFATGFTDFRLPGKSFWTTFFSTSLEDLTLEVDGVASREGIAGFWTPPPRFQHRLRHLSTNLLDSSLVEFLDSCVYLETVLLKTSHSFKPQIDYASLFQTVIRRHGRTLRSFGFYPTGEPQHSMFLDQGPLREIQRFCPNISELGFALSGKGFDIIESMFRFPQLRTLHIEARFLHEQMEHSGGLPAEISIYDARLTYQTKSPAQVLANSILRCLEEGQAPLLRIVAFNGDFPYRIERKPLRLKQTYNLVASSDQTQLFRQPFLDWTI